MVKVCITAWEEKAHHRNIAILSHTWAKDEVLFQDMRKSKNRESARQKAGFEKINQTCILAKQDGLDYAWIDSCCIDKSSSAELSEAINSMFAWYRDANKCYTYLEDVSDLVIDPRIDVIDDFSTCRWFTRGWTLQELVASFDIRFYSRHWNFVGTKEALVDRISAITGIDKSSLRNEVAVRRISVAQKMSWASKRETTRIEDLAYCLMGIFDVHMPLLYGEGTRAFQRLQLEIIQMTSDDSIFAFQNSIGIGGVLARSPNDFQTSFGISRGIRDEPYSVTNIGLRIKGIVMGGEGHCGLGCIIYSAGGLDCGHTPCYFMLRSKELSSNEYVCIRLQPIDSHRRVYARVPHAPLSSVGSIDSFESLNMTRRPQVSITIVLSEMSEAKDDFFETCDQI